MTASGLCMTSAGAFLLVGLLAGSWKYWHIATSPDAKAPLYVDLAHRAGLMYAFACALLSDLTSRSAWPNAVNVAASAVMIVFFALALLGYLVHGALRDTDNQLARPHRLGSGTIPAPAMTVFMAALMFFEIAGFVTIFAGFLAR